jgi:hypothetical protein
MDSVRELALMELIESRTAMLEKVARTAPPPEPDALVRIQLKPRPHLNSGAVALTEPDDPYLMV